MSIKNTTPTRKSSGNGKIFFGLLLIVAAVGGFAFAEHSGLTGTHIFFKASTQENDAGGATGSSPTSERTRDGKQASTAGGSATAKTSDAKKTSDKKNRASKSDAKPTSSKKKSAAGTASGTSVPAAETIPDFVTISRQNQTWPTFLKLTRSRNISISDPKTGISMGRMDIPAGTLVKVSNIFPDGAIVVLDRAGRVFQVSAGGTNFTGADHALRTRPEQRKGANKKTEAKPVATATSSPARQQATQKQTSTQPPPASSGNTPKRVSAFGVFDASDWDDEDDD